MKAFPTSQSEQYPQIIEGGMDLRDYFAAKAMLALIAHPDSRCDVAASVYAKGAYEMADAMMEARK